MMDPSVIDKLASSLGVPAEKVQSALDENGLTVETSSEDMAEEEPAGEGETPPGATDGGVGGPTGEDTSKPDEMPPLLGMENPKGFRGVVDSAVSRMNARKKASSGTGTAGKY